VFSLIINTKVRKKNEIAHLFSISACSISMAQKNHNKMLWLLKNDVLLYV